MMFYVNNVLDDKSSDFQIVNKKRVNIKYQPYKAESFLE
jgi:hypothetical protein